MSKILAFGETHHGTHNKEIALILAKNKFEAIFFELPNDFEKYVNSYMGTGIFPERIEKHIKGASKEGNNIRGELELLFNYSKDNNIPIICIDSSKTKTEKYKNESEIGKWYLEGESRDEDMFNNVIRFLKKHEGNFLLITGSGHLKDDIHHRSNTKTLGKYLRDYMKDDFELKIL